MYEWMMSRFSICATSAQRSVIRELLKLTQKPEIISFAGGLPSPETFPIDEIADLACDVIRRDGSWALQYSPTEGIPALKDEIIKFEKTQGITVTRENLLITSASQQGLDLVSRVFLNRRNPVIVGRPSYVGALGAFQNNLATIIGIDLDHEGMRLDLLGSKLKEMRLSADLPKFIYLVPDFQNPSGITMPLERRKAILNLAREYHILIIEDTPYRSLRYTGDPVPTFYELDAGEGYVISLHTFSKILFPGLRLGWILAIPGLIDKFVTAKQAMDLCSPALTQALALEYCKKGLLANHIQENIAIYAKKRQVMLDALEAEMPEYPGISWTRPEGGLFLWVTLPDSIDVETLFYDALEEKVAYVVGTCFYTDGGGKHSMRLNFSYPSEEEIIEGIKRLGRVVHKKLKK